MLNVEQWLQDLKKKGSLTDEELSQVGAILTKPQVSQEVRDAFMRQSDYSRHMDELRAKQAQEDAYAERLAAWEGDVKTQLSEAQRGERLAKEQLYTIAAKYGVEPTELQTAVAASVPRQETPVTPETPKNVVTKEEIDNYGTTMFRLNAKLIGLNQEHIRLFGKPMEKLDDFVDHALKGGQPIEQAFRSFYSVEQRETELREQEIQSRIQKAIEEEKTKWITQGASPLGTGGAEIPKGMRSPILENIEMRDEKAEGDNISHRNRVAEAVAAFNQAQASGTLPSAF